jgi:hypothetical protein
MLARTPVRGVRKFFKPARSLYARGVYDDTAVAHTFTVSQGLHRSRESSTQRAKEAAMKSRRGYDVVHTGDATVTASELAQHERLHRPPYPKGPPPRVSP